LHVLPKDILARIAGKADEIEIRRVRPLVLEGDSASSSRRCCAANTGSDAGFG
jgi:hypothetical protein